MREENRRLQRALLPRNAPTLPGYDIAAGTTLAAEGHGNSLWDWFALPDGRVALVTLDAASEDFLPAHRLAVVRAFMRELPTEDSDPARFLRRVNAAVSRTSAPGSGGPVGAGVLVLGEAGASWLGAGTVHGGVIRRAGTLDELQPHGPPLGLMDGFRYGLRDVELGPGDVVFVLSNGGRGLFRGAADLVAELHGRPGGEVLEKLQTAMQRAAGEGNPREQSVLFVRRR